MARSRQVIAVLFIGLALIGGVLFREGRHATESGGPAAGDGASPAASTPATSSPDVNAFLYPEIRDAPPIALLDADAAPFTLASLRGHPVLVFFGYTHCPDVCPATVGIIDEVMSAIGPGLRAVFVSIDPERDTAAALKDYGRYLPPGWATLTGGADAIRATADAWGVRYAKVETGIPDGYSMSHTGDVFLVDADGRLRADFPFGTDSGAMTAVLRIVVASGSAPGASPSSSPTATQPPSALVLRPEVVSSSVWAGEHSPVVLSLLGPSGRVDDTSAVVAVQLATAEGTPVGEPVVAVAVRPPGLYDVSFVASLDIPSPGAWRFDVTAQLGAVPMTGSTALVTALDGGATPAIGAFAPTLHTPTLDDVGGLVRAVTTDPAPDLRLSSRSTTDALAGHVPFVLVLDSTKFRVTSACGRALVMVKYLLDRWPGVIFIHQEPFRYSIVTDTPVLDGPLLDPPLTAVSSGWGMGGDPWSAISMPWIFVVDGQGIVRAKYQGVIGSEDVDVIVALIAQGG
jgi:protein SCO1/2